MNDVPAALGLSAQDTATSISGATAAAAAVAAASWPSTTSRNTACGSTPRPGSPIRPPDRPLGREGRDLRHCPFGERPATLASVRGTST
jgi:hypothetical protein